MVSIKQMPKKIQYVLDCSFPFINKVFPRKAFVGGRIGYPKEDIFKWLLFKKVTHWDYRSLEEVSGISHQTFIRRNQQFLIKGVYETFFVCLVKQAVKKGLIKGEKVALDGSFVPTYSKREEVFCGGYNGYKKAYGFKLHVLIDAQTRFPLALVVTDGLMHDSKLAIPLLKRAKRYLKKKGYVLADKAYDDTDIIAWIMKELSSKAGIPIRKKSKLAKGKKGRYGNLKNWQLKTKGRTLKKSILKLRTTIERLFSQLKRKFHLGKEATRGLEAFKRNVYQSLICYCLEQLHGIGMRCF